MPINTFNNDFLTWRPDVSRLTRPAYLSLANQLEEEILSGRLSPGTRLPPQRELADYLDLNFTTVTRAYNLCRERGLLYGVTGRGSYVAASSENPEGSGLLELGVVHGFATQDDAILAAARNVLSKPYLETLYSYDEPTGHPHQRAAGVQLMQWFGVKVDVEHTAVFSGSQNVISAALLSLFRLGDTVATDEFTYANLIGAARLFHIQLLPIAGDTAGMFPEALEEATRRQRLAGVFLMPTFANPTTCIITAERRDKLAEVIAAHNLILLEDDHFGAPQGRPPLLPMQARLPNQTIYICGPASCLCPGLRVTFAAFPDEFRARLLEGVFHLNIKTSAMDAEIITELILNGDASRMLRRKNELAQRANALFDRLLPGRAIPAPECFFRWLLLRRNVKNGFDLENDLAQRGVRLYHSHRFAVRKNPQQQFLRISVSSIGDLPHLEKALKIVADYLEAKEL